MTDLAALLDAYPDLDPAQRAEIDARVDGHPEWHSAWTEARHLASLLDAAAAPVDADDLAQRAVGRRMGVEVPRAEAIDAARAADPALDAEGDRIEARLREFDRDAEDPIARFERLTGRTLVATSPSGDSMPGAPMTLFSAPPRPRLRLVRASRWAAAAGVLLVAYGGLLAASTLSVSERAQVAALGEVAVEAPTLRSGGDAPDGVRLEAAVDAVHAARRSTLGLFPRYDDAALDDAADELGATAAAADPASWISQEARLAQGRVLLYRGRDAEATRVLGGLVQEGSYRGSAARRLLDYIRS